MVSMIAGTISKRLTDTRSIVVPNPTGLNSVFLKPTSSEGNDEVAQGLIRYFQKGRRHCQVQRTKKLRQMELTGKLFLQAVGDEVG
jgi:hypothetical protein